MAKPDRDRVKAAQVTGSLAGLRDAVMLADPEVMGRHRAEWPRLWERIDRLVDLAKTPDH